MLGDWWRAAACQQLELGCWGTLHARRFVPWHQHVQPDHCVRRLLGVQDAGRLAARRGAAGVCFDGKRTLRLPGLCAVAGQLGPWRRARRLAAAAESGADGARMSARDIASGARGVSIRPGRRRIIRRRRRVSRESAFIPLTKLSLNWRATLVAATIAFDAGLFRMVWIGLGLCSRSTPLFARWWAICPEFGQVWHGFHQLEASCAENIGRLRPDAARFSTPAHLFAQVGPSCWVCPGG